MKRSTLTTVALVSLLSFALLASVLAHGHGFYRFETAFLRSLGSPSSVHGWASFAELIATPAIIAVLAVAFAFGAWQRCLLRVAVFAGFAAVTFLVSEHVAKPLVHETYANQLTFPSGNVTAVCATSVAMWLALYPLLGKWGRGVTLFLGAAWVLLMSLAVVGAHWHTPFDALGSVLLSLGLITASVAIYEVGVSRRPAHTVDEDTVWLTTDDAAMPSEVGVSG